MNAAITYAIGKKTNKKYKLIDVIFKDTFKPSTD